MTPDAPQNRQNLGFSHDRNDLLTPIRGLWWYGRESELRGMDGTMRGRCAISISPHASLASSHQTLASTFTFAPSQRGDAHAAHNDDEHQRGRANGRATALTPHGAAPTSVDARDLKRVRCAAKGVQSPPPPDKPAPLQRLHRSTR